MLEKAQDDFVEAVHELTKLIPLGRVTTYGAIAYCLGSPKSARMVGWALHHAVHRPEVPAHRVVNRNGYLTGKHHFVGEGTMEELLAAEGVAVKGDRVEDFARVFWHPKQII
ncbi:MAG: MGMT family protein [Bacteroidota bacterium]